MTNKGYKRILIFAAIDKSFDVIYLTYESLLLREIVSLGLTGITQTPNGKSNKDS